MVVKLKSYHCLFLPFSQQFFSLAEELLYSIPVIGSRFGGYYKGSVVLDDLLCTGNEFNLTQCNTGSGTHQCTDHSQDAGVRCMYETQCESNSLRLIPDNDQTAQELYLSEGSLPSYYFIDDEIHRGRLEICMDGEWSSICYDESWNNQDAIVACEQLGFSSVGEKSTTS